MENNSDKFADMCSELQKKKYLKEELEYSLCNEIELQTTIPIRIIWFCSKHLCVSAAVVVTKCDGMLPAFHVQC